MLGSSEPKLHPRTCNLPPSASTRTTPEFSFRPLLLRKQSDKDTKLRLWDTRHCRAGPQNEQLTRRTDPAQVLSTRTSIRWSPCMQTNCPLEIRSPIGWISSTFTHTWASSAPIPENWPLALPAGVRMNRYPTFTGKTNVLFTYSQ